MALKSPGLTGPLHPRHSCQTVCSSVLLRLLHFFIFISVAHISGWTEILRQSSSVSATGFIRSEFARKSHKYCHWEMQRCAHSGQCRVGSPRGWHRTDRLYSCSQPPTKRLNPSRQLSLEKFSHGWHQLLWSASWGPTLLMEVRRSKNLLWFLETFLYSKQKLTGRWSAWPEPFAVCQLTSPNPHDTSCIDLVLYWCSEHHAAKSNISWKPIMPLPIFIDEVSNLIDEVSEGKWVCLQDWFFMKLCWQPLIIFFWSNPLSIDCPLSLSPSVITMLGSNVRLISL